MGGVFLLVKLEGWGTGSRPARGFPKVSVDYKCTKNKRVWFYLRNTIILTNGRWSVEVYVSYSINQNLWRKP